jgi:hypothetical protein
MQVGKHGINERQSWKFAFVFLLIVSAGMLALRAAGAAFLVPEFEFSLVYLPTILAAVAYLYQLRKLGA